MNSNQECGPFNRNVRGLHKCVEKNPSTQTLSPARIGVAAKPKVV